MLDKIIDGDFIARLSSSEIVAATAAREQEQRTNDWPALAQYPSANAAVATSPALVMIGDSITAMWGLAQPELFDEAVLNRGISGQTSPQILVRFYADVIDLKPRQVHILCGTNDVAGNTGPNTPEDYMRNIRAMLDLAMANDIDVLLGSITPAATIGWSAQAKPLEWIPYLNRWLRGLAAERSAVHRLS